MQGQTVRWLLYNMDVPSPILRSSFLFLSSIYFSPMCILNPQVTDPSIYSMLLTFRLLPFETKLHIELASKPRCRTPRSALPLTAMSPMRGSS